MPLTSRMDSLVPHLPSLEVSPLHVFFISIGFLLPHVSIGANINELHLAPSFLIMD